MDTTISSPARQGHRRDQALRVALVAACLGLAGCGASAGKSSSTSTPSATATGAVTQPQRPARVRPHAGLGQNRAHVTAQPADLGGVPANATGWLELHSGTWDYKEPADHSYVATSISPSGIDISSTTSAAHFGIGRVIGSTSAYTLDQISASIFAAGSEAAPGTQAQITATYGPVPGPSGSEAEVLAWAGTQPDGTAVTGLIEIENWGYGYVSYDLNGPSSSWSQDLPTLLALKANTIYTPPPSG